MRRSILEKRIFYLCPKCGKTLVFHKMTHTKKCMRCGQRLEWGDLDGMQSVYIRVEDSGEAAYWAEKYQAISEIARKMDIESWRLSLKGFPKILCFPCPEGKEYGRFMRMAAKEAAVIKEF